jgi:hypothetical protein
MSRRDTRLVASLSRIHETSGTSALGLECKTWDDNSAGIRFVHSSIRPRLWSTSFGKQASSWSVALALGRGVQTCTGTSDRAALSEENTTTTSSAHNAPKTLIAALIGISTTAAKPPWFSARISARFGGSFARRFAPDAGQGRQFVQDSIQHQQLAVRWLGYAHPLVQDHFETRSGAFRRVMGARVIDQDPSHHLRRHAEEVRPILPRDPPLT